MILLIMSLTGYNSACHNECLNKMICLNRVELLFHEWCVHQVVTIIATTEERLKWAVGFALYRCISDMAQ